MSEQRYSATIGCGGPSIHISLRSVPIAAQPDRRGEECRRDGQADPQTRADQELTRS